MDEPIREVQKRELPYVLETAIEWGARKGTTGRTTITTEQRMYDPEEYSREMTRKLREMMTCGEMSAEAVMMNDSVFMEGEEVHSMEKRDLKMPWWEDEVWLADQKLEEARPPEDKVRKYLGNSWEVEDVSE
jgi:hypothetical protein